MDLTETRIHCPYCGEPFETVLDPSEGEGGYFEDCFVCCRPIYIVVEPDREQDTMRCQVFRDDEVPG